MLIVEKKEPILLIGGGDVGSQAYQALKNEVAAVVAADGGANFLYAQGDVPDAVIGDFDSIDDGVRHALPSQILFHIPEQNSTDLEKSLTRVAAPVIFTLGFTGSRLDHQMAAQTALVRFAHKTVVHIGQEDVMFLCPPELRISLPVGARLSVYPMAPVRVASRGLRWPLDGLDLSPIGQIATSNEVTSAIELRPQAPHAVIVASRQYLSAIASALSAPQAGWPDA
jgi:thiamine pyrophosphokinase